MGGIAAEPAYTRLALDERRSQLLAAGAQLFAQHAYEEISMRDIARVAGVSKPLLYHYFPSKADLFKAAIAEKAAELQARIRPNPDEPPLQQLAHSIDAYLGWVEENAETWSKLMQSAATLPEARQLVEGFRQGTMELLLVSLTGKSKPRPALRNAIRGWLGYMDAAILDWAQAKDLPRETLGQMLLAAFGGALASAQQADPQIKLELPG